MDSWFAGTTERPPGHQSFLFVQAADTHHSSAALPSFPSNMLTGPQLIQYVQAVAVPLAFWFKPVCVCLALFWLCYRAYLVLNKPLDELALLLGFDIPLTPNVAIAGIKADGAIIHWSLPEKQKQKNSFKYEIHLNGAIVDTLPSHESAVTISGLQPGSFYVARVALVNSLEYSSKSAPVRFRTKSITSGDFFHQSPDGHETDHDTAEPLLRVKPYRGLKDVSPAAADSTIPGPIRDLTILGRKRSNTGRRVSPAVVSEIAKPDVAEILEGGETVQQLTEKLDALRRECEELDRQAREEEEEEVRLRDELLKERDELRAEVAEKEKASRNLQREVKTMEGLNKASQREREKAERLLHQKIQERQKIKDDIIRWTRETEQMVIETEKIRQDQAAYTEKVEEQKRELRQHHADHTAVIKVLEEEIRETTAEIKKVERSAKSPSPNGELNLSLVEQLQHDAEEDRLWKVRTYELQTQYAMAAQRLEQSKRFYYSNLAYLENMRDKRRQDEAAAAAASATSHSNDSDRIIPSRRDSQRSRRGNSGHAVNESPGNNHFVPVTSAFGNPSPFASGSLFSFSGNTALTDIEVAEEDRERLTGGALMSPGAGEGLLPADLFSSDDKPVRVMPLPGLGMPGFSGQLPGLGQTTAQDTPDQGPASPASITSRPASTFASPQASQQNLHHHLGSPEALIDSDGRSIRSNRSGRAASNTGSRFSAMFGIRARPKNGIDGLYGGVPLNKIHSHSMPRQDQGIPGLDSTTRKRNSSLSDNLSPDEVAQLQPAADTPATQVRKRPFTLNPFNRDKSNDGWPSSFSPFGRRPTSPRPGSTHSGELPRPSTEGGRWGVDAWPSTDSGTGTGARASPLSLGQWNPSNNSRTYQPNHPSRRTSLQYGGSDPPADIIEDDDSDVLNGEAAHLAPIGTKPAKVELQNDNKLNPNAKDFKYFLSSMRGKNKDGSSSRNSTPVAPSKDSIEDDHSPPQSRKSRDALSTFTLESSFAESRRPSTELVLSPTYSNSDAAYSPQIGAGSLGKESFMQKISRKSSSSKFSLPTFKREKSRLDRDVSISSPSMPQAEDDDDAMSASVGSVVERESSEKGRNNTRTWSNVLKIGKKKTGNETPSISELSTASTGDDNDEM